MFVLGICEVEYLFSRFFIRRSFNHVRPKKEKKKSLHLVQPLHFL